MNTLVLLDNGLFAQSDELHKIRMAIRCGQHEEIGFEEIPKVGESATHYWNGYKGEKE